MRNPAIRLRFPDWIAHRYEQLTDTGQQRFDRDLAGIEQLDEQRFMTRCELAITEDALFASQPGTEQHSTITVIVDALWNEADRRHQVAGHTEACDGDNLYAQAAARNMVRRRIPPAPSVACTCGHDPT